MAQADLTDLDPSDSGPDLVNFLQDWEAAIHSANKGSTAPTYAVAGLQWIDDTTTPWVLKRYDGADWISEGTLDPTSNTFRTATPAATTSDSGLMSASDKSKLDGIEAGATANATDPWGTLAEEVKTADYTVLVGDAGKFLVANKATSITFNLSAAATLGANWLAHFKNIGAGDLTIDANSSETIEGALTLVLRTGETASLECNGSLLRIAALRRVDDAIEFVIDGGGQTITTGVKGDIEVPWNCTVAIATLLADQSGSIVVDVWKDSYANYPPVVGDKITASAPPTITSATKSQDATLTGWTTTLSRGDILRFNVNSVTGIQRATLSLKVAKT